MIKDNQLKLFEARISNPVFEIKRRIRTILSTSSLSRDQIADDMNALSSKNGFPGQKISKLKIDNWCRDSDVSRMPSLIDLVLFCAVVNNHAPLDALAGAVGCRVIDSEEMKVLAFGRAELNRRYANKRARVALLEVE